MAHNGAHAHDRGRAAGGAGGWFGIERLDLCQSQICRYVGGYSGEGGIDGVYLLLDFCSFVSSGGRGHGDAAVIELFLLFGRQVFFDLRPLELQRCDLLQRRRWFGSGVRHLCIAEKFLAGIAVFSPRRGGWMLFQKLEDVVQVCGSGEEPTLRVRPVQGANNAELHRYEADNYARAPARTLTVLEFSENLLARSNMAIVR